MAVLSGVSAVRPAAAIFVSLAMLALSGCYDPTCDEYDDEVAQARALPQPVLAALYEEAKAWSRSERPGTHDRKVVTTPWPGVEVDGRIELRSFTPDSADVPLRSCIDEWIGLELDGLDSPGGRVVLYWGAGPTAGRQVLWHEPAPAAKR